MTTWHYGATFRVGHRYDARFGELQAHDEEQALDQVTTLLPEGAEAVFMYAEAAHA
jgi:hypothetical protein